MRSDVFAGLRFSKVSPDDAGDHLPSMKLLKVVALSVVGMTINYSRLAESAGGRDRLYPSVRAAAT
jgi:hypothetical protein